MNHMMLMHANKAHDVDDMVYEAPAPFPVIAD